MDAGWTPGGRRQSDLGRLEVPLPDRCPAKSMFEPPPITHPAVAGWPRPLAFALSGGGAFGSVHIGMLAALREAGIQPDLIVGTSIGALHGAVLAAEPEAAVDRLTEAWQGMDRRQAFGGWGRRAVNVVRHGTLGHHGRLAELLERHVPADRFEHLRIPFAAVATDAISGEPALLSAGDLHEALLASAAVPGLFAPVEIDGTRYIDGGVTANVPIRQAIAFGARSVISLDATPPVVATTLPRGFVARSLHTVSLMLRSQRSHAVDELAHRYRIAALPSPTPADIGSFNFGHTPQLIEDSHRLARETLESWAADSVSDQR